MAGSPTYDKKAAKNQISWQETNAYAFKTLYTLTFTLIMCSVHIKCQIKLFELVLLQVEFEVQSLLAKSAENMLLAINKNKWIIMLWHIYIWRKKRNTTKSKNIMYYIYKTVYEYTVSNDKMI